MLIKFVWVLPIFVVLIPFFVWIFLIAPKTSRRMDKFKNVKYAHRGLHGTVGYETFAAENSLTAFLRAVEHGYGIELDVHATKDGEIVVFHDATLDRICGASGKIKDLSLDELSEFRLLGTEDKIPTLREVLQLVGGRVPLLVELKESGTDHTISEKTAEILSGYDGDYIVESFSPAAFGAFKKRLPDVPRGFLADKLTANNGKRGFIYRITQRCLLNVMCRPQFIALNKDRPTLFPIPFIKKLFKVPTIAWTVTSPSEEERAYADGFSGVIFENYLPEVNGK